MRIPGTTFSDELMVEHDAVVIAELQKEIKQFKKDNRALRKLLREAYSDLYQYAFPDVKWMAKCRKAIGIKE